MTGTGTAVLSLALEGPTLGTSTIGMGVAGILWGVAGVSAGVSFVTGFGADVLSGSNTNALKRALIGGGTLLMGRTASDKVFNQILEGLGSSVLEPYQPNPIGR
jgi:hypothetical protein